MIWHISQKQVSFVPLLQIVVERSWLIVNHQWSPAAVFKPHGWHQGFKIKLLNQSPVLFPPSSTSVLPWNYSNLFNVIWFRTLLWTALATRWRLSIQHLQPLNVCQDPDLQHKYFEFVKPSILAKTSLGTHIGGQCHVSTAEVSTDLIPVNSILCIGITDPLL